MLDSVNLARFREQGYLFLEDFVLPEECQALRQRAEAVVEEFDPQIDPRCRWSVGVPSQADACNAYFFESLDKVSCFFDPKNFGEGTSREKTRSVLKLGHALHDCDPYFAEYSHSPRMRDLARGLGYQKPLIGQSRYFFKQPGKPGAPAHQDSAVLYTEPLSCYGVWLALNDVDRQNGCLWAIPGSHHQGLSHRVLQGTPYGQRKFRAINTVSIDDSAFIPLEVPAGTAILLGGELVHKSGLNHSNECTQVYSVHFIEGAESHRVPGENWLQRPGGFRAL